MNILELREVDKKLGKNQILNQISLSVKKNEVVALIGPNGSGKSTLMKLACGLLHPDRGQVLIDGMDLAKEREKGLEKLSAVIEEPALYPQFTGRQHLEMLAYLRKIEKKKVDETEVFIDIGENIKKRVTKYSMGMKQRLALGMSMLSAPELLILDEPTNGLDPSGVFQLRKEIMRFAESGCGVLISSHILGELQVISDRFLFLKEGKLQKEVEKEKFTELEEIYKEIYD